MTDLVDRDLRWCHRHEISPGLAVSRAGAMSALVALTVALTVELLRVYPALSSTQFTDVVTPNVVVALLIGPFVLAPLVLVVASGRDPRVVFVGGALVLAGARLGVQLTTGSNAALLAGVGLAAALCVLAVLATLGLPVFGAGVLAGVMLDAALHVALASRHLVWVDSHWAVAAVVVLCAWYLWLVRDRARRAMFVLGRRRRSSVPLVLVGPVLVVEGFMLANLGWLGEVTTFGWAGSAVVVGSGAGAGVVAALHVARHPSWSWLLPVVVGAVAVGVLPMAGRSPHPGWAVAVVLAQISIGIILTLGSSRGVGTGGALAPMLVIGTSYLLVLGALGLLDGRGVLGVPAPPAVVLVMTGATLVVAALVIRGEVRSRPHRPGRAELVSLMGVLVVPAGLLVTGVPVLVPPGAPVSAHGEVRVVTYNVGLAFDLDGRLNLEAVGDTLDHLAADVVSLQEVPRGHLPTGGVDMVGWLQRRLELPHMVFQASSPDALHGNAILSRFPISQVDQRTFDRVGTALPRGALAVEIHLETGEPLVVIGAHLPPGGTLGERRDRVERVLDVWGGRPRSILAADLNSQPGSDILTRFEGAGFNSAWNPAWGDGFTFPADSPRARIDWVMHTADLEPTTARVGASLASDHRPLLAVFALG